MKRKKKKGFTLVEVIAALAILTAGITVIYSGFMNSSQTWKKEKVNLELVSGAQSISQVLKARGKVNLEAVTDYDNNLYVYFDEYSDIYESFELTDFSKFRHATSYNFTECNSLNTNKKYGALLQIQEQSLATITYSQFKYYKIDMKIWSLSTGAMTQSTFYIGGDDI
jgi:prepilin-type N-terminal cleavage/methylation domain-containing protein